MFAWGTSWVALRMQLGVVAPEVSLVRRFVLASALMLTLAAARGEGLRQPPRAHLAFAGMGALMCSTNFVLVHDGGLAIPAGLLAVVFSTASVMNLALGAVRFEPRIALGGALGASGVAAMFAPELLGRGLGGGVGAGLGLRFAGTPSSCLGNLVAARPEVRRAGLLASSAWGMIYGTLALTALSLARGQAFVVEPTLRDLGSLAWLAVVATVAASLLDLTPMKRIGPARAGYATVLFPVVALLVSTAVEGYRWTLPAVLGLALVAAGNLFVLRRPAR